MMRILLRWVVLTCALTMCTQALAQENDPVTIQVEAGKLADLFKGHEGAKHLVLTGQLNTSDFGFLREQSGIEQLDLSGVSIVVGGKYTGNASLGEEVSGAPNTLPDYWLFDNAVDDLLKPLGRSLISLTLPNGLEAIGRRTLQGAKISQIDLPDKIKRIGDMAFGYCKELQELTLPESCLSLGSSVFVHCKKLSSISLPDELRVIPSFFLQGCDVLREVSLPAGVDSIKAGAFQNCVALESVTISKRTGLKFVGNFAFEGCKVLTSIQLGYMLDQLGKEAFAGCSALASVTLSSPRLRTIPEGCFKDCSSLESFVIPAKVSDIGAFAFSGCKALSEVIWPSALKTIMGGAFAKTGITRAVLPPSTQSIGYAAFVDCAALERLVLPTQLQAMGEYAFARCTSLIAIEMPAIEPPLEGIKGLAELVDLPLYVPEGSVEKYKAAEAWRTMKKIQADKVYVYALTEAAGLEQAVGTTAVELIGRMKLSGVITEASADYLKTLPRLYDLDLSESSLGEPMPVAEYTPRLRRIVLQKKMPQLPERYCARMAELQEVVLPEGLEAIGEEAFEGCSALNQINIPSSVREIGNATFTGCSALRRVELPKAITLVPDMAFFGCAHLDLITLGQEMAEFGEQSFANCVSLSQLSLPAEFNEIKDMAFFGCDSLKRIECHAVNPPTVADEEGTGAFSPYHYIQTIVYVPKDAKAAYEGDDVWKRFAMKELSNVGYNVPTETRTVWTVYAGIGYADLQNETGGALAFEIFDLSGMTVMRHSFVSSSYRIALPAGVYVVRADGQSRKIVVR